MMKVAQGNVQVCSDVFIHKVGKAGNCCMLLVLGRCVDIRYCPGAQPGAQQAFILFGKRPAAAQIFRCYKASARSQQPESLPVKIMLLGGMAKTFTSPYNVKSGVREGRGAVIGAGKFYVREFSACQFPTAIVQLVC